MELSIVIPCFNEEKGLSHLIDKLRLLESRFNFPVEFIFVDDGSSDSTYAHLEDMQKCKKLQHAKIVRHEQNKGVGAAVRTGISRSSSRYVASIDSDCTYEPDYLIDMFNIIKDKNADIITASPYHPKGHTSNVPGYRLFLSKNLSRLYNLISRSRFYTYTSIFRIYRAEGIKAVNFQSDGFLAMAEILIKSHKKGLKIIEYPAELTSRKFGESNAKILKLIKEHICFIIRLLTGKE